jgi:DNA-binding winged helix-turn-helix (wHTH) protein/tetratricopeptide (TPR) repeat protein
MRAPVQSKRSYRFGLFEADLVSGELRRQGVRVRLQDQPFRVLTILLEYAGEVVPREELRQRLWPADTYVEFDGSLNAALKRLRSALGDSADNPIFIETLPKRGYRFIAPVAVEEVQIETVAPVDVVVEQSPAEVPELMATRTPEAPAPWRSRVFTYGAALMLVLLAGLGWYVFHSRSKPDARSQATPSPTPPIRKSVAVLGLRNVSARAEDEWLATAFSEMLSTELASGEKLRLVSGEDIANLRLSSPWPPTDSLGQETSSRIGTALNSDLLVLGSYTDIGGATRGQLRVDVRVQDAKTGEILSEVAETGSSQDLFRTTSRIGAKLRERLGVPALAESDEASVLASVPLDREAARFYALGLDKLRQYDALPAREYFERAIKADPLYAEAHAALSEAWSMLGFDQKAVDEIKKAYDLGNDLPRRERVFIEARYRILNKELDKALQAYRTLFDFFPDDIEYGLRLAEAQANAGKREAAAKTIQALRRLPAPARDDPRIDLTQELNEYGAGHYEQAEQSAAQAIAKAKARSSNLLAARALCRQAYNLAQIGQDKQAVAAAEEARGIYTRAGNQFGVSAALAGIGRVQYMHGEYEAAERTFQKALATDEAIGNKSGSGMDLRFLADVRDIHGDLQSAAKFDRQALAIYREIDDREHVAYTLLEIAWVLKSGGDALSTLKIYDEAIPIFRELSNEEGVALSVGEKGNTLIYLGELSAAEENCQQALRTFRKINEKNTISRTLFDLANIAGLQDRLEDSRRTYSEALSIEHESGDEDLAVSTQLQLARIIEEQGHHEEAKQQLNQVLESLHTHKAPGEELSAQSLLAEIALQEGNPAEAGRVLEIARGLLRPGQWLEERYVFEIVNARFQAATGKPAEGANSLKAVLADATKHNYLHYELEARLALCELEGKANPAAARIHGQALRKDASAKGFGLVARKALALAS